LSSPDNVRELNVHPGVDAKATSVPVIAVVIPCFRVKPHIAGVLGDIGAEVSAIYCVDDACPHESGKYVEAHTEDPRVKVLYNTINLGVGGATLAGYKRALEDGAEVIIKIDGDGQMDPRLISKFVRVLGTDHDYVKGNRFYNPRDVIGMPWRRIFGNAVLSFLIKLSSGYWNIFDPTNGYTAIHAGVLRELPLDSIDKGYFFESDLLFRLGTIRAVVGEVPMKAVYGDQESNLSIVMIVVPFLIKHLRNFTKRIVYNYYLRNFNIASLELPFGLSSLLFGLIFGGIKWVEGIALGTPASAGTVMIAGLPIIVGIQMLLAFLNFDVGMVPRNPIHRRLS
jgi:glycosyltransferase involved in cell wall biosynthesis